MTIRITLVFLITSIMTISQAQNLINNPGFEQFDYCPPIAGEHGGASLAHHPNVIKNWEMETSCSPDYYNSCMGPPISYNIYKDYKPRSGNAMVGLIPNRESGQWTGEYLKTKLKTTLIKGAKYKVRFYTMRRGKPYKYATDGISVFLANEPSGLFSATNSSVNRIFVNGVMESQVLTNPNGRIKNIAEWCKIEFDYIAQGTENFLILGYFSNEKPDLGNALWNVLNQVPYYFFDDFSITLSDLRNTYSANNIPVAGEFNCSAKPDRPDSLRSQAKLSSNLENLKRTKCYDDIAYFGNCGTPAQDCWRVHLNNSGVQFTADNFGSNQWFNNMTNSSTLLVGDFNNDEFDDIGYFGNCSTPAHDCWRIHLNNQNGEFIANDFGGNIYIKSNGHNNTPFVGDFNADGFDDIGYFGKCGNSGSDCWRIHINNQNGEFVPQNYGGGINFFDHSSNSTPVSGDFNNDGYSDIAYYGKCGNESPCWRVHINNQNGSFVVEDYGGGMWFKGIMPIHKPFVGDFDNNGFDDIGYFGNCSSPAHDCWRVHLNNQNGELIPEDYGGYIWFKSDEYSNAPIVGDFNGDGFDDLSYYGNCSSPAHDCWRTHLNNQNGLLVPEDYGGSIWFKKSDGN